MTDSSDVEREFLEASVAVWREIDRCSGENYQGIEVTEHGIMLRRRERQAWESYRDMLDETEKDDSPPLGDGDSVCADHLATERCGKCWP